jgi:hypothetical protein
MGKNAAIPDSAMFTVEEYLTEREMSDLPVLLVEGNDDSIFFQLIKDELIKNLDENESIYLMPLSSIEVDTPIIIKSPEDNVLGNRGKVEYICETADSIGFKGLLVGFVDREFREFDLAQHIHDRLKTHNKLGRVIWSRGHSLENYLFDWGILRDGLRDYGVNSHYSIQDVLEVFRINFDKIINIACAISLAARDVGLISVTESSLDPSIFTFNNDQLQFALEKWDGFLSTKMKLDESRRNSLVEALTYYLKIVNSSDAETLRWVCHGHIGMNFIWSAFEACIIRICDIKNIPQVERKNRKINHTDRFIKFSLKWIQQQLYEPDKFQNTPIQCFQILCFSKINLRADTTI